MNAPTARGRAHSGAGDRSENDRDEGAGREDDDLANRPPSKSQRKRDMHELQSLGEELVALNADRLAVVEMPEDLRDAVREAQRIRSHEGRRRQLQYIGRLMREVDPAPIREKLAEWAGQSREAVAREHEIAAWRDRLIDDDASFTEFSARCPGTHLQRLRTLARNARADKAAGRAPRQYRELFRVIREAMAQGESRGDPDVDDGADGDGDE
jgi:ribosome-associated protein